MNPSIFPCWAIVSQMGHRTTAGHVTVDTTLGTPLLVVEVPGADADASETTDGWGETTTRGAVEPRREIVSPQSLYSVSVTTEAAVRAMVARTRPRVIVAKPLLIAENVEIESDEEPKPAEVLHDSPGERVIGCPDGVMCRLNGCTPGHCNVPF